MGLLSREVSWTISGSSSWSGTYLGREAVVKELLEPLDRRLAGRTIVTASAFHAVNDVVVVEGDNASVTKSGSPYPNKYCWVIRMHQGRIVSVDEYADTKLMDRVLGPRPRPQLSTGSSTIDG